MALGSCPFCRRESGKNVSGAEQPRHFSCRRCGEFDLSETFLTPLGDPCRVYSPAENDLMRFLPAFIRHENSQDRIPDITRENWRDFARLHAATSVSEKVARLRGLLAERSRPGYETVFDLDTDAPLLDAQDSTEAEFILYDLVARREVEIRPGDRGPGGEVRLSCKLTPEGWSRLEPGPGGIPGRCFISMSFDSSLTEAYLDGIRPALREDCRVDAIRLDLEEHNEKICDRILVEIRKAEFVVADVTLQRPGVYFEAGFAIGIGRPVVWMCRTDELSKVHFDTRQYSYVAWSSPADLRVRLSNRVLATIPSAQARLGQRPR